MEPYVFERVTKYFKEVEGTVVKECGLFIHPEHNFLAASPDGLIGDNCVLEIKCPYSKYHQQGPAAPLSDTESQDQTVSTR